MEDEETAEEAGESGNWGPPGTLQILPLTATDRGGVPEVCKAYLVPLVQGTIVHEGRRRARRAPESAGEANGQEASGGARGHLERAPAPLPGLKG